MGARTDVGKTVRQRPSPFAVKVSPNVRVPLAPCEHPPLVTRPKAAFRVRFMTIHNVVMWFLLTGILFGQIFGVVLTSVTTTKKTVYGQPPQEGLYVIPGLNDDPFSDRAIVCVQDRHGYRPVQLSQLLKQRPIQDDDRWPTNGRNAYRVITRDSFTMDTTRIYTKTCMALTVTLDNIFSACESLGYNVTRDVLRVVDGVASDDVLALPNTIPVLILPFWDATPYARYAVPSYDGRACVFRTGAHFGVDTDPNAVLWAVPRTLRDEKTEEWLGYPGGVWRHGWYEDPVVKMRWYSDVISSLSNGPYGIAAHRFDLLDGVREIDCPPTNYSVTCGSGNWIFTWNDELTTDALTRWFQTIAISNGSRFGLFLYEDLSIVTIASHYSLERLIGNASFAVLLARWMTLMVALYPHNSIGIAALANAWYFKLLPLLLLPRLRTSLEGFWTSACVFDGDQSAVADAWFYVYPAIGEIVILYFSVLNSIAKLFRRRMSDTLFGPTLVFFVLLHARRHDLASLRLMDGDQRVTGIVTAEEAKAATVLDYIMTDLAFRIGGRVKTIFFTKLVVLGVNLIPLFFSHRAVDESLKETDSLRVEKALSINFEASGGFGSIAPPIGPIALSLNDRVVQPYEIVRAGYILVGAPPGPRILVLVDHWFTLAATARLPSTVSFPVTVAVYDVIIDGAGIVDVSPNPRIVSVNDRSIRHISVRHISSRAFR